MKRVCATVFSLTGVGAVLLAGCEARKEPVAAAAASPGCFAAAEAPATNVLECLGTLHPVNTFTLRLNPNDTVESVHVRPGDLLKQGDLLARLFNPVLQGELVAARERILALRREALEVNTLQWKKDAAAARLAELSRRLDAQEALRGKIAGYDPQTQDRELVDEKNRVEREVKGYANEIQQHVDMRKPAGELIRSLEQRISEIECRLERLTVRAPHAGVVVRLERGLNPQDGVLLELHDRSGFVIRGALWQNQLERVRPGCGVDIMPDYSSGKQWKGRVVSIGLAPVVNAAGSFPQYPLEIALDDYDGAQVLRDGMTVTMRIRLDGGGAKP
jgi:multidrug resistance efflux pump